MSRFSAQATMVRSLWLSRASVIGQDNLASDVVALHVIEAHGATDRRVEYD